MENIKELFAEWGLWSLVEDISDDGDGEGDNLQLTPEGKEASRMIEQELDKAREEVFTKAELKRIGELLGFMRSDYPSSYWEKEDDSIEKKLSKLKDNK